MRIVLALATLVACVAAPARAQLLGGLLGPNPCTGTASECAGGAFGAPFAEPTIDGVPTTEKCITGGAGQKVCKPAAGTIALLRDGRFLYWDALEGTENVSSASSSEFGDVSVERPEPRADARPERRADVDAADARSTAAPTRAATTRRRSSPTASSTRNGRSTATGALFCADRRAARRRAHPRGRRHRLLQRARASSRFPLGVLELEGLKNARIFNPHERRLGARPTRWSTGAGIRRWSRCPTATSSSRAASRKLVKPVYPDDPFHRAATSCRPRPTTSACGTWSENGALARALAADVPAHAPAAERPRLLQRRRPGVRSVRTGLRPGALERRRRVRPGREALDRPRRRGLPAPAEPGRARAARSSALNPTNPQSRRRLLHAGARRPSSARVVDDPAALRRAARRRSSASPVDPDAVDGGRRRRLPRLDVLGHAAARARRERRLHQRRVPDRRRRARRGRRTRARAPTSRPNLSRIDTVDIGGRRRRGYSSRLTGKLNHAALVRLAASLLPDGSVHGVLGRRSRRGGAARARDPGDGRRALRSRRPRRGRRWRRSTARAHTTTRAMLMPDGRVLVGGHAPITTAYLSQHRLSSRGFAPGRRPRSVVRDLQPAVRVPERSPGDHERPGTPADVAPARSFTVDDAASRDDLRQALLMRRTADHAPRRRRPARGRAADRRARRELRPRCGSRLGRSRARGPLHALHPEDDRRRADPVRLDAGPRGRADRTLRDGMIRTSRSRASSWRRASPPRITRARVGRRAGARSAAARARGRHVQLTYTLGWQLVVENPTGKRARGARRERPAVPAARPACRHDGLGLVDPRVRPDRADVARGVLRAGVKTTVGQLGVPDASQRQGARAHGTLRDRAAAGRCVPRAAHVGRSVDRVSVTLMPGRVPGLYLVNASGEDVLIVGADGEAFLRSAPAVRARTSVARRGAGAGRPPPRMTARSRAGSPVAVAALRVDRAARGGRGVVDERQPSGEWFVVLRRGADEARVTGVVE